MNKVFNFRYQGQKFSIKVSSFNGRISLGSNGWLMGEFWSVDSLVRNCREIVRHEKGTMRVPSMNRRTVERIEDFVRTHENAWLGN
ncbi:hypothetical protein EBR78_10585 [bacterium]|nr:hypothetical protein [bacterium]